MPGFAYPFLRRLFLGFVAPALLAAADPGPVRPASPGEINAGLRLDGTGFSLSPDGRWAIFNTSKGQGLVEVATGGLANARPGWAMSGLTPVAAWSPHDSTLALLLRREGRNAIAVWDASGDGSAGARELLVLPRKLGTKLPCAWSPDGRTVYVVVTQDLPWPKLDPSEDNPATADNNVELQFAGTYIPAIYRKPRFQSEYPGAYAESNRGFLLAIDVATGRAGLLAKGNDIESLYVAPDGRHLLAVQLKRGLKQTPPSSYAKQLIGDVYLVDLTRPVAELPVIDLEKVEDRQAGWSDSAGQRLEPILPDLQTNSTIWFDLPVGTGTNGNPLLAWSPDGTRFAYATVGKKSTGDVFVYDLAAHAARNLTAAVSLERNRKGLAYATNITHVFDSAKFGDIFNPLWLPDGRGLLVLGQGDAWLVPVDPAAAPRDLTADFPHEVIRIVPSPGLTQAAVTASGETFLIARDRESRLDSVWRLNPATGALAAAGDTGVWTNLTIATDRAATMLVYTGQGATTSRNLWRFPLAPGTGGPALVTRFKLELADRAYPRTLPLAWKTPGGYQAYGLLYVPAGASPEKRVPLVFDAVAAAPESRIDARAKTGAPFFSAALNGLLQQGCAVLVADIPLSDDGVYEQPMKQSLDGVNAAVDAVLATGLVDEKRLGLMGTGYDGTIVNFVVTQTDRFKAAVSISGLSDWFADYAGGGLESDYHEFGGGRFGVPVWTDPARYVESSPIRYFDHVHTPLLLIHGQYDSLSPIRNAWETFHALEHLDKPVIFARYTRGGHGANPEGVRRIQGWFREHLLGGKPITHIADQGSFIFGEPEPEDELAEPMPTDPTKGRMSNQAIPGSKG